MFASVEPSAATLVRVAFKWFDSRLCNKKENHPKRSGFLFGDPYGNRTHVTAVKGRCLNRLTNGPGSGDLIRTGDIPGMNRLLYQLSYAAIFSAVPKISFVIIHSVCGFVKNIFVFPQNFLGKLKPRCNYADF